MMKKIVSFFGDNSKEFCELNDRAKAYAQTLGLEYLWAPQNPFDKESVIKQLNQADAGIIDVEPYDESIFKEIKSKTGLLVRYGVGYDKVDLEAATQYGIAIARTTAANSSGVAEMALTLMLASKRMINQNQACLRSGNWVKNVGHELIGGTVGILGFGNIGKKLANLLKGFDCRIVTYDQSNSIEAIEEAGVELVSIEELFKISDAISIHVPYCDATHNLVDKKLLSLMKTTAVIVNTARGNIVDEDALYDVLSNNKIAGAGFDVFADEPLSMKSPLMKLDNMILTPHVSSQTMESNWNIYKMAIDICADFFFKKQSKHILNPDYLKNCNLDI